MECFRIRCEKCELSLNSAALRFGCLKRLVRGPHTAVRSALFKFFLYNVGYGVVGYFGERTLLSQAQAVKRLVYEMCD